MKIHKGDTIVVITGKDRGKSGLVTHAFPKKLMVVVEGVNMVNRHKKATRRGSQGQIVSKPMPIDVSNVALKDAKTGKPARVGYTVVGEGADAKKKRVLRPRGAVIE